MSFFKLLLAILLTIAPVTELRAGLPIAIDYALENNISIYLMFVMILLVNMITVFFIFIFLDYLHLIFIKIPLYRRVFKWWTQRVRNKTKRFKEKYDSVGFLALAIFVAVPLPGTGAWTGSLISWMLNLDRKKSILAILIGVILSGLIVFLGILGFLHFMN